MSGQKPAYPHVHEYPNGGRVGYCIHCGRASDTPEESPMPEPASQTPHGKRRWCRSWSKMLSNSGQPVRVPCKEPGGHEGPHTGWIEREEVAW